MKIAIIAFYHSESSLCLAKSLAVGGCEVDYYFITDIIRDHDEAPGFKYLNAPRRPGINALKGDIIPELIEDSTDLKLRYYLLRILSLSKKVYLINKVILRYSLAVIKKRHYDAINIIGQHPWVKIIHLYLKGENMTHTLHEVGEHWEKKPSVSPLMQVLIAHRTKVILPSFATFERYESIPGYLEGSATWVPMGKFLTYKLYERHAHLNPPPNTNKIFLFYGLIKEYKGLGLLRKSVEVLKERKLSFDLIIAGDGSDPNLSYFRKLPGTTVISRSLSNEEIISLNKACTCVVCPYLSASQSGIVMTSFLYGKPIIATKVGAFAEIISDHENGLLVTPNSYQEFASAMELIINDDILLRKLSEGASSFGNGDEYDWINIGKRTKAFLLQ